MSPGFSARSSQSARALRPECVVCLSSSIVRNMGIKGLMKLISDEAPEAVKEYTMANYNGRVVAIDASMAIYQFLVSEIWYKPSSSDVCFLGFNCHPHTFAPPISSYTRAPLWLNTVAILPPSPSHPSRVGVSCADRGAVGVGWAGLDHAHQRGRRGHQVGPSGWIDIPASIISVSLSGQRSKGAQAVVRGGWERLCEKGDQMGPLNWG